MFCPLKSLNLEIISVLRIWNYSSLWLSFFKFLSANIFLILFCWLNPSKYSNRYYGLYPDIYKKNFYLLLTKLVNIYLFQNFFLFDLPFLYFICFFCALFCLFLRTYALSCLNLVIRVLCCIIYILKTINL